MIENSDKFTENEIQKYQNVGMPQEITEALDKLKFNGWNYNDQRVYEGEVQEVITYYGELERREEEGLIQGIQKGLQKGLQWGQIKGLVERFFDHESLQKSLRRIEQNSIPKDLVEQVWHDLTQNQPTDGKNLEDFLQILQNAGILQ
jgi:flagellar biosynthesis/type III secretory pathway protein FliH